MNRPFALLLFLMVLFFCVNCAGPTSPFGAVEFGSGDGTSPIIAAGDSMGEVQAQPKRQVLHRSTPLKLQMRTKEPLSENVRLQMIYNGKDVSSAFTKRASRSSSSRREMTYVYEGLRLRPDRKNQIDIFLSDSKDVLAHLQYLPPDCAITADRPITTTDPFQPPIQYLKAVANSAKVHQLNPSMLAGLIAQESGFNPEAVSSARAVGLTQVTPLAEREIARVRPNWPKDDRIDELNAREIAQLIREQKVNAARDWRLNPLLSVEGGAVYLAYIRSYWSQPENHKLIELNPNIDINQVILASYNSGAARVKAQIEKYGQEWMSADPLKEAFRYVNRVSSYCYHFSENSL